MTISLKTGEFLEAELLRHLSVWPLKEFVVGRISTNFNLSFLEDMPRLIFQLYETEYDNMKNILQMRRNVWKCTIWHICGQGRLKLACAYEQFDQSICCPDEEISLPWLSKTQNAPNEDSDQTAWMRRLIWSSLGAHVWRYFFWHCGSNVCYLTWAG